VDVPAFVVHFDAIASSDAEFELRHDSGIFLGRREPLRPVRRDRSRRGKPSHAAHETFVSSGVSGSLAIAFCPCASLRGLLLREVPIERIQLIFPEHAVLGQPGFRLLQRLGRKTAMTHAALLPLPDETCALQNLQVLHHGRERHPVRRGQHGDRSLAAGKGSQDRAASGVCESLEGRVQPAMILNHRVYHYTSEPLVSRLNLSKSCNTGFPAGQTGTSCNFECALTTFRRESHNSRHRIRFLAQARNSGSTQRTT